MIPAGVLAALIPVVQTLDALGIPYHVGGSVASAAWSFPRTTNDVAVVADLQPAHVAPFVAALEDRYYVDELAIQEAIRTRRSFNLLYLDTMFKIDIFPLTRPFDRAVGLGVADLLLRAEADAGLDAEDAPSA